MRIAATGGYNGNANDRKWLGNFNVEIIVCLYHKVLNRYYLRVMSIIFRCFYNYTSSPLLIKKILDLCITGKHQLYLVGQPVGQLHDMVRSECLWTDQIT